MGPGTPADAAKPGKLIHFCCTPCERDSEKRLSSGKNFLSARPKKRGEAGPRSAGKEDRTNE